MLKNYLKIAFRSILRSRAHAAINVLGLSLAIACAILIALFVRDEWTFDTFNAKANRIYRAYMKEDYGENERFFNTVTPFPLGRALQDNFQEIETTVRIVPFASQVKMGDAASAQQVTVAGQDFFRLFDFVVIAGSTETALHNLQDAVITREIAKKYFGTTDAVGKVLALQLGDDFENFTVKTVVEDVPSNSSIRFGILIADLALPKLFPQRALESGWFNVQTETYVLLREGADQATTQAKFPPLFKKILGPDFKGKYTVGLQPLLDIHLDPEYPVAFAPVNNPRYSYILGAIALLILSVACINFVTLSVGRSLKRAKEVGIRKVVGAARRQLISQFIGEAMMVCTIALVVGGALAVICLPLFNTLSGKQLVLQPDRFIAVIALALLTVIGLVAGSYPAFVLSNFKPITILKGALQVGNSKQRVRKVLVGVQLVLSIFLISSTLVMRQQLSFLQNKSLGFDKEQIAVIPLQVSRTGKLVDRVKAGFEKAKPYEIEMSKLKDILSVCASSHDFGNGGWTNIGYTDDNGTYRSFAMNTVDENYLKTLNMTLAAGRDFSRDIPSDARHSIIVNEAFVKEYGWKDALGKRIPGQRFADHEIIGVVKDFNYASLYTRVEPLILVMDPTIALSGSENININNSPFPKLLVRLRPGNMEAAIDQVRTVWNTVSPGEEFTLSFVDQALEAQYRNDQNLGKIVSLATLLAIIIGSLGLYALASLAMQNKIKEISIRKVFGASERSLLALLSAEYIYLIGISLLISVPATVYFMTQWLKSFEFRISIGWEIFAMSGGISLLVALLAISYQAIRTAWSQPAKTLKYE
jgi:putative ABC transport system permease protein